MRQEHFDVLVVGAGPAGLAAAASAAQNGVRVGLVDDNPLAGGQIWRGGAEPAGPTRPWLARLSAANVNMLTRTRVIAPLKHNSLLAETPTATLELAYDRLILATGARELFLPFPGWTLPGVLGAGGLQALAKGGLPVPGKRVVVAGSGPLLLAVAAHLKGMGARIELIAEQAPLFKLIPFGIAIAREREKLGQAAGYALALRGGPFRPNSWVTQAHGTDRLEAVTVQSGDASHEIDCDFLACAYGLVPNVELAAALGCALRDGKVRVGSRQQTSVAGVYCAGEATGIGGVDLALVEGRIAGLVAAGRQDEAAEHFAARRRALHFAALLDRIFELRDELKTLPADDTIVCRCEDATYGQLRRHDSWRSAKLHTRCGMGPCQGRVCGAATSYLFGWGQDSVRPPIAPARVASLAELAE